jgi:hypothetical protein
MSAQGQPLAEIGTAGSPNMSRTARAVNWKRDFKGEKDMERQDCAPHSLILNNSTPELWSSMSGDSRAAARH